MRRAILLTALLPALASAQEYGASASVQAERPVGSTTLSREQAQARPGALGEPARALLDAPGAARASFAGGELILWGAAGSETRTYVDGVEIPTLFHPAGLRTTVHPALIDRVSVTPGALPAEYGRGLGGAVDIDTVRLRPGGGGELRVDAIDGSLSAHLGDGAVRGLIGARYGYFDHVLRALAPQSQGLLAVPSHQDGVARVELTASRETRLSATWIGARDDVTVRPDSGRQRRSHQQHVGMLRLERRYADGARLRITPFLGFSEDGEHSVFERVPLTLVRRGYAYGTRADFQRSWATPHVALSWRVGVDLRGSKDHVEREGSASLPAREGDIRVFGQAPVDQIDRDRVVVSSLNAAPWTALTLRWRGLTLAPSVRLETYVLSTDRLLPAFPGVPAIGYDAMFFFPEPRLTIGYRASSWLRLEARAGLVHQAPEPRDLSAAFGNPTLMPARGLHDVLAARFTLPAQIVLDLAAFQRTLRDLSIRTPLTPVPLARQLTADGRGSTVGGSLSARRELEQLFFALSYTWSRSVRSDPDGRMRRFDFDQPHVLSGSVGFARAGFLASVRLRAASGMPRSRVIDSYLDGKTGLAQPLFGAHNAVRLPAYVALDLHLSYDFALPLGALSVLADVLNATDRDNVEDYAYQDNYMRRRDLRSIPIVAMLGLRWRVDDED